MLMRTRIVAMLMHRIIIATTTIIHQILISLGWLGVALHSDV